MLAALLGGDPGERWEHTIIYTKHTIITPKSPLETAAPQAVNPFTPVYREHGSPPAFLASSDTFMCHWILP